MRCAALVLIATAVWSADTTLVRHPTRLRLSGEVVELDDGSRVLWGGLGYDALAPFPWLPGVWVGLGGHGAMAGNNGGAFVLGGSVGWRQHLGDWLVAEVGGFAGGGGGAGMGQGDGLLLRGHAQLGVGFAGQELALGVAYNEYVYGTLADTAFTASWSILDDVTLIGDGTAAPAWVDLRRWTLAPSGGAYLVQEGKRRSGGDLADRITLIGGTAERDLGQGWALPLRMAAAVDGGAAGYMEVFGGIRWQAPGRLAPFIDALVGFGGGGDVDTGGGLLLRPDLGWALALGGDFSLRLSGGWTVAPDGDFQAVTVLGDLAWTTEEWTLIGDAQGTLARSAVVPDPWHITVGVTRYDCQDGREPKLVNILIEKPVLPWLAFTGRTRSAFAGGAGGYSEGLFGLALTWEVFPGHTISLGGEAGAGGGGGMATEGGAIASLTGRYRWQFLPAWGIQVGAGRLEAVEGDLVADLVEAGLVWSFARGTPP